MKNRIFRNSMAMVMAIVLLCTSVPLYSFADETDQSVEEQGQELEAQELQEEIKNDEELEPHIEGTADNEEKQSTTDDGQVLEGAETLETQTGELDEKNETNDTQEEIENNEQDSLIDGEIPEEEPLITEESQVTENLETTQNNEIQFTNQELHFVDLAWEETSIVSVDAVFEYSNPEPTESATDPTASPITVPMQKGERGKFTAQIPEGNYDTIRYTLMFIDGASLEVEAAYNYQSGGQDTYYYDRENGSYWGVDALHEDSGISTFSLASEGNAGKLLYFVPLTTNDSQGAVKRVLVNFYSTNPTEGTTPACTYTMYQGRENIYSAPLPAIAEGSNDTYEHLDFYVEYENGATSIATMFSYTSLVMDTYFYNCQGTASYWGAHPTVANRSLESMALYVDYGQENSQESIVLENSIFLIFDSQNQGAVRVPLTQQVLGEDFMQYDFSAEAVATENTLLTIEATLNNDAQTTIRIPFYLSWNDGKNLVHLSDAIDQESFLDTYDGTPTKDITKGDASREIPKGTYQKEDDTYYASVNFYDYYSNWELQGNSLKTSETHAASQGSTMNAALSNYFSATNNETVTPLYMNMQKNASSGTYRYNQEANTWAGAWNTGQTATTVVTGLVDGTLQSDQLTMNGIVAPYFNESFLRGANSANVALGYVYKDVQFPFTKNQSGYWEFNSLDANQTLRLSEDDNRGYFLNRTGESGAIYLQANGGTNPSYSPFNDPADQERNANGQVITGSDVEKEKINYLFGNRFDIPFTLPVGNQIQLEEGKEAVPVTFEFSGDDDAWVFVDGNLVLDMGGVHDAVTGKIDFKAGQATITQSGNDIVTNFELDPTIQKHTLTMFYMERGLGTSNLKLTFNFPLTNSLDVTNHIDMSGAANEFQEALARFGGFDYQLKNLAVSGESLAVEDSAGYISSVDSETYHTITNNGNGITLVNNEEVTSAIGRGNAEHRSYLSIENRQEVQTEEALTEEAIFHRSITVRPATGDTIDAGNYAYLRMDVYSEKADRGGESVYVALVDAQGNRMGGRMDELDYDIGSNALEAGNWNLARLDFNKMSLLRTMDGNTLTNQQSLTFDRTNITAIQIASMGDGEKGIDNMSFYAAVTQVPKHGFSVTTEHISDYGSIASQTLMDANGAWYGHYNSAAGSQATYNMVSGGQFALASGQRAEFLDKFRPGSYLYLRELVNSKIFDTTVSVLENQREISENALLATRTDTDTVKNTGNPTSLMNLSATSVEDGRVSVNQNGIEKPQDVATFVYRSYEDPDDNAGKPVQLNINFDNRLKTGSITIHKVLRFQDLDENIKPLGMKYVFDLHFNQIAGQVTLEEDIVVPVTLTITEDRGNGIYAGSITYAGIPAGTEYQIYEQASGGAKLGQIEIGQVAADDGHEEITLGGNEDTAPYISHAIAYASNQAYTFSNTVSPFYMDIEKVWNDAGYQAARPEQILIQIQRKLTTAPEDSWELVSYDFNQDGTVEDSLTLTGEGNTWSYHMKQVGGGALPLTNEAGEVYEYRIRELDDEEYLGGLPEDEHKAFLQDYVNRYTVTSEGVYRVTNTPRSLTVVKRWADNNDPARPIEVLVQVYREAKDYPRSTYGDPIRISVNNRWRYVVQGIETTAPNGERYTYSIEEKAIRYSYQNINSWIEAEDDTVAGYQITYEPDNVVVAESTDSSVLTVVNTKDTADVVLKKIDTSDENITLKGAKFLLQRLMPRDVDASEQDTAFVHGGYNNQLWMVNQSYTGAEYTTGADGMVRIQELPYGMYRITEIEAPNGYYTLEQPIDFEISKDIMESVVEQYPGMTVDQATLTVTIKNQKKMTLPTSGAGGTLMFALVGLACVLAGLLLYKMQKRKERRA